MQKNNIKSFICSFLFSILAVLAVQKVFLRADQTSATSEPSLDNTTMKKISLFAENKAHRHKAPVLMSSSVSKSDTNIKIAKSNLTAPVVNIAPDVPQEAEEQISLETPQKQNLPTHSDVTTDLAYAEEITFTEQEQNLLDEQKHLSQTDIVYADISDTFEETPLQTADASLSEEIPLIEDNLTVHGKINLQNNASASQIAMVEPNALINSIEEPDILSEEKNLAEADIKKSELGEIVNISDNTEAIDESAWEVASAASEEDLKEDSVDDVQAQDFEEPVESSPWVIAKGNKYAKNQAAVEAYSTMPAQEETAAVSAEPEQEQEQGQQENTTELPVIDPQEDVAIHQTFNEPLLKEKENSSKLAYEMIQNILIPIPDDILNDADIVPDLTASPDGSKDTTRRIVTPPKPELDEKEKQTGLFKSISSWFNKNKDETTGSTSQSADKKDSKEKPGALKALKDKVYSALGSVEDYKNLNGMTIMPAELRLSFAPNRAEISGQTLRWIYAFADNARDHDDVYIEVRIDGTSSYALQQKRLNLLSSIFASRGVDYRKINTIFTSREPNSFIIRNIRFNNDYKGETEK